MINLRPFGIIVLIFVSYIIVNNENIVKKYIKLLLFSIVIETFINVGYFISIGTYELQYSEILIAILGILSIIILIIKPCEKRILLSGGILAFSVVMSIISLILFPLDYKIITFGMSWSNYFYGNMVYPEFNLQTIKMGIRFILYIAIATATVSVINKERVLELQKGFIKYGIGIIGFIIIEFIIKNIFRSNILSGIIGWFFGTGGSTVGVLLERGSIYSLQALTREPSHLASAMFWFGLIVLFSDQHNRVKWKLLIPISLILVLSRSFAGILYILSLYTIYAVLSNKKFICLFIAIIASPVLLLTKNFNYYLSRFTNIFRLFSMGEASITSSEHIRLISIIENLKIFMHRPLFGIGIGTSYAHGAFPSILSNIGLIGLISWLVFTFKGIAKIRFNINNIIILLVIIFTGFVTHDIAMGYSMSLLLLLLQIRYKEKYNNNTGV